MIRAAEQSINMQGMLDATGESTMHVPFRKLTEKKKKVLDKKNPIPGPNHPSYLTMIKGAVLALNESKGASKPAILKYLAQHYQLGENLPKINSHLCMALRKALKEGNIEQTSGHGASGSFKMTGSSAKKTGTTKKFTAAKPVVPKAKQVIKKKAAPVKTVNPKVARKIVKKPTIKKTIKKKTVKKLATGGKLRMQKKRVVGKSKAPKAKKA